MALGRFLNFFFNFRISDNFRKFQVGNMQNDTWKNKTKSVKPPNRSRSSTWALGNENTKKKVTLLTRERANFTSAATLTFKSRRAKTKTFFKFFGNFFEALVIFPLFVS